MLAGIVVFAVGLVIRAGLFAPAAAAGVGAGAAASPTTGPAAEIVLAPTMPTPSSTVASSTLMPPPASVGEILFADEFDTEAAWPIGPVTGAIARYENGAYVLDAQPIDLPGYVFPAAGDGPLPEALSVSAEFDMDRASNALIGLVVNDASGGSMGALLSADGRVVVIRDSFEAFDILGSGSADVGDGPVRLSVSVGPAGTTAVVDGHVVVSLREHLGPVAFGIAVWSQLDPATIIVDRFEVRAAPDS